MPQGKGTYGSKRGRPPAKKKMMGGSRVTYKKGSQVKKLTKRQEETLKKHSKHHTPKHMAMMKKLMKNGKTFTEAHKITQKKIGA